jgi:hypothetical protein
MSRQREEFFARGFFSTQMMEETRSFETSVHTRPTGLHIPEDGILKNYDFSVGRVVDYWLNSWEKIRNRFSSRCYPYWFVQ